MIFWQHHIQDSELKFTLNLEIDPGDVQDQEACRFKMTTSVFYSHFSNAYKLQKANSESQCLNFDRLTIWWVQIMKICAISDVWWRFAISLAGHKVWVNITFCFMQHAIDESQWKLPVHCCSSCTRCMSLMTFIPNLRFFFFLTMLTTTASSQRQRHRGLRCGLLILYHQSPSALMNLAYDWMKVAVNQEM